MISFHLRLPSFTIISTPTPIEPDRRVLTAGELLFQHVVKDIAFLVERVEQGRLMSLKGLHRPDKDDDALLAFSKRALFLVTRHEASLENATS